jgi:hypothetical protein
MLFNKQKVLVGKARTFLRNGTTRTRYSNQDFIVLSNAVRFVVELKQWRSSFAAGRTI